MKIGEVDDTFFKNFALSHGIFKISPRNMKIGELDDTFFKKIATIDGILKIDLEHELA